jgi:hypothetical protein
VPVAGAYWERAEICWPLVRRLAELGIVGEDIQGYGCAGMSPMACGLASSSGKFQGTMAGHTPIGPRRTDSLHPGPFRGVIHDVKPERTRG